MIKNEQAPYCCKRCGHFLTFSPKDFAIYQIFECAGPKKDLKMVKFFVLVPKIILFFSFGQFLVFRTFPSWI
jgi:hypothetical protein